MAIIANVPAVEARLLYIAPSIRFETTQTEQALTFPCATTLSGVLLSLPINWSGFSGGARINRRMPERCARENAAETEGNMEGYVVKMTVMLQCGVHAHPG